MTASKIVLNAASGVGGAGPDVDEVFSTHLYTGTGSNQTITNGIDLSGEGGLVWVKGRSGTAGSSAWGGDIAHNLFDSSAPQRPMNSATTNARTNFGAAGVNFTSTGFTVGYNGYNDLNYSTFPYVSWTFRKAEKFFDVVTYTGDGTSGQTINHNLGTNVGAIIIKCTDTGTNWAYWHRTFGSQEMIILNSTGASRTDLPYVSNVTDSSFTVNGSSSFVNENTKSHVAYLFAHNDGDGDFGPDADADIIKCGSYTNSGSAWSVDLGFEPQFLLRKLADGISDWQITDTMRGLYPKGENAKNLRANATNVENNAGGIQITPTGIEGTGSGDTGTWIYIAIRRPTAVPESGTDVFAVSDRKNEIPSFPSGFPVDFLIGPRTISGTDNNEVKTRLISGSYLRTNTTDAENSSSQAANFAHNDGFFNSSGANASQYSWMWKRAPNFCDVVAYSGTGTSNQTLKHNLGVVPEMMWVKRRNAGSSWLIYHNGIDVNGDGRPETDTIDFTTSAPFDYQSAWFDTAPTDTEFTVGSYNNTTNNGSTYIAYLFASLDGISKVGSVTQSGTTNVDCGFTSGARFVLLRRTDASGDWYIWDSTRGILSGNDPYLLLNSTAAQVAVQDYINPLSSGFTITSNFDYGNYIFYAIA